jgi:hypothetical protein
MKKKPRCLQVSIKVTDNWYPCYEGNEVHLSYNCATSCCTVSGADDFAMYHTDYPREEYERVSRLPNLNKQFFLSKGFRIA